VAWDKTIRVPFAPETPASGINLTGYVVRFWYRRTIDVPSFGDAERLLLHFGAVDYEASVWAGRRLVARHEGGYTPFACDVTREARGASRLEVVVRADDDPFDLAKPRGKQDWMPEPHVIWYPRTSGIWQTVWLERVPEWSVDSLRWTPSLESWAVSLETRIAGVPRGDLRLRVRLRAGTEVLADDTYTLVSGELSRQIALSDPGVDDFRNELLWSPEFPALIQARLELSEPNGRVLDLVHSYTALRSIGVQGDRVVVNGRPYQLRMVLDQGYWQDTGMTAPDDAALARDVTLAKAMGFNGVRKHQKVEDPRYLYWADRLGLLVWGEMPSAYRFTTRSVCRLAREWLEVLSRDYSHPCISAWVPFNESWGVPNLPEIPAQRHFVQALYHLTKTFDPTRPVVGNDGWESVATDLIGIHDYEQDAKRLEQRYEADRTVAQLFARERPGGRILAVEGHRHEGLPVVLSEFGGIAYGTSERPSWGYARVPSPEALAAQYTALVTAVRSFGLLAGFCYTQFADTYQETNGLLDMDRRPKIPLTDIALATRGPRTPYAQEMEAERRARFERLHGNDDPA
jgi:hypothetical protein